MHKVSVSSTAPPPAVPTDNPVRSVCRETNPLNERGRGRRRGNRQQAAGPAGQQPATQRASERAGRPAGDQGHARIAHRVAAARLIMPALCTSPSPPPHPYNWHHTTHTHACTSLTHVTPSHCVPALSGTLVLLLLCPLGLSALQHATTPQAPTRPLWPCTAHRANNQ